MFKLNNGNFPIYLIYFISNPLRKRLRSSSHFYLCIIPIKHSYAKSAFAYSGPFLWNSLYPLILLLLVRSQRSERALKLIYSLRLSQSAAERFVIRAI